MNTEPRSDEYHNWDLAVIVAHARAIQHNTRYRVTRTGSGYWPWRIEPRP